jgi:ATP-dependent DNA ligase
LILTETFESKSSPGTFYTTSLDTESGISSCTCRGWIYNHRPQAERSCVHTKALVARAGGDMTSTKVTRVKADEGFISPMLASPYAEYDFSSGWFAEEKFDGHRLIVQVKEDTVTAWSRNGKPRVLTAEMADACAKLISGTYDGEILVPGERHHAAKELTKQGKLTFVVFDVLHLLETSLLEQPYKERRNLLDTMKAAFHAPVQLATSMQVKDADDIAVLAKSVWDRTGEGLILKHEDSIYEPGKRGKFWLKVKNYQSEVLVITGFSEGELGECAVTHLIGVDEKVTSVKTKDADTRRRIAANPNAFVAKLLRIEHQGRTPDGGYVSPMWDRLEEE